MKRQCDIEDARMTNLFKSLWLAGFTADLTIDHSYAMASMWGIGAILTFVVLIAFVLAPAIESWRQTTKKPA